MVFLIREGKFCIPFYDSMQIEKYKSAQILYEEEVQQVQEINGK